MQNEFLKNNLFIKGLKRFENEDPQLSSLKELKFVHPLDWWKNVDWNEPGILILTGGRQIGKTTSTKLLIKDVLQKKTFLPEQIFYLPCDMIDDYHHLAKTIHMFTDDISEKRFLIIIDEITFVKNWDRAIKALADEGIFKKGFCILTGSDSIVLKEAASRFPGRRGSADVVDHHLYPLNFAEFVKLVNLKAFKDPKKHINSLFDSFEEFMKCGGYLRAINELYSHGEIRPATYFAYEQWIRGDFERRNKDVKTLAGVLKIIYETTPSQVTFSGLTQKLGQVSKETFIDYVNLLERMDIIFDLQAFDQNTKLAFPKKARKIHFADPFVLDTIEKWLETDRYIKKRELDSTKAESIVAGELRRNRPVYYMKTDGEIDAVVVHENTFIPLEVKWKEELRASDIKQLSKYANSIILTKTDQPGKIDKVLTLPLPLYLISQF